MVQNISASNTTVIKPAYRKNIEQKSEIKQFQTPISNANNFYTSGSNLNSLIRTTLTESEKQKYTTILDTLKNVQYGKNSCGLNHTQQIDLLLKNGKLLSKSPHDNSTVLDNLYNIATKKRAKGLDKVDLILNTLDTLTNPRIVTQTFGDIPDELKGPIINVLSEDNPVKSNPSSMDVTSSSGTCAAASIEVSMADKFPAEFARWVSELSSENMQVILNLKLSSLSKNTLAAVDFIKYLEAQKLSCDLKEAKIKVDLDEGAPIRAQIQSSKYWDKGERTCVDVLLQSAIMKLGSQNTYNSLNDIRSGKFNSNPQGLIEVEKTFAESLIKNKEITSLCYQKIDDEQNLLGYACPMETIQKHIVNTLDSGDNVILGYVLTNETAQITKSPKYDPKTDGGPNKIIQGHEITVLDYYKNENGEVVFVCVDTDDDSQDLVQYSASYLLPKIHHAGYPAHIVADDEEEIMKNVLS